MIIKVDQFLLNTDYIVFVVPINNDFFKIEMIDRHYITVKNENQIELQKIYNKFIKQLGVKDV
jgi:hypothetical protein